MADTLARHDATHNAIAAAEDAAADALARGHVLEAATRVRGDADAGDDARVLANFTDSILNPRGIPSALHDNLIVDFFEDHAYSATTEDGQRVRKTAGGLFIPDTARGLSKRVRVIAVGPGRWSKDGSRRLPMEVKVGDVGVAYKRSEYKRIPPQPEWGDTYGGRELLVVPESEILGLL